MKNVFKFNINKEKIVAYSLKVLKIITSLIMLIFSFMLGRISYQSKQEILPLNNPYSEIHNIKETSIATNESHQLLIIDKATGSYTLYSDSVGMEIFKLYSNKIQQKYE